MENLKTDKLGRKCTEEDLKRMNDGDWWLSTFIRAHNYDVDITYAVVAECIQWRRNFQVENISILGMKPLLDRRVAYLHGKDLADYSIREFLNMLFEKEDLEV
ncbi:unnamed protein product, partial [Strongylus vulgaris]